MTWTPINKPTISSYTNVNPPGRTQYDQSDITYDDPNMFYDGINPNSWTNIAKPVSGISSTIAGFGTGLLMPLTRSSVITTGSDGWTKIPKPII